MATQCFPGQKITSEAVLNTAKYLKLSQNCSGGGAEVTAEDVLRCEGCAGMRIRLAKQQQFKKQTCSVKKVVPGVKLCNRQVASYCLLQGRLYDIYFFFFL